LVAALGVEARALGPPAEVLPPPARGVETVKLPISDAGPPQPQHTVRVGIAVAKRVGHGVGASKARLNTLSEALFSTMWSGADPFGM